jgi:hypothetical protein
MDPVERFVYPRGRPGPTVYVWSTQKQIPKDVRNCVDGRIPLVHNPGDPWNWPATCDFYVMRSALSWQAEKAANSMGAQIVVLPEGAEWLAEQVTKLTRERDVYIFRASKVGDRP